SRRKKSLPLGAESASGKPGAPAKARADRVELVTLQRKPSIVAESFRSTLISILFASDADPTPKVLVVSSAEPGEGKSTVTSNLAIAMAEVGQRVLLIDADMRRPRQHDIFAVSNERGLSSLLRERAELNGDRSIGGIIQDSLVPGLFLLSSGPGAGTTTNLLYGPRMPELLRYLRSNFDIVLIDTPPMLQMPDARVIGRVADGVILVIRAGHTTRDAAIAARKRFSEDGIRVIGTVLNDWNPKSSPNGYYGYHGGYYYGGYRKYYGKNDTTTGV
ncbi:MAG: CpsD/CapB family tyrosine-protein kinase, partial [Acidobacteriaceae bacterium]|nr:CpsD/CapB family tyrosine-protein kinase [Acidobacteriaceae bacterium]